MLKSPARTMIRFLTFAPLDNPAPTSPEELILDSVSPSDTNRSFDVTDCEVVDCECELFCCPATTGFIEKDDIRRGAVISLSSAAPAVGDSFFGLVSERLNSPKPSESKSH
jgi:hypothetical protein